MTMTTTNKLQASQRSIFVREYGHVRGLCSRDGYAWQGDPVAWGLGTWPQDIDLNVGHYIHAGWRTPKLSMRNAGRLLAIHLRNAATV